MPRSSVENSRSHRESTSASTRDVMQSANDAAISLGNRIESVVDQAQHRLREVTSALHRTQNSVAECLETVTKYTQANPKKALLLAVVSGAVVWSLLRSDTSERY